MFYPWERYNLPETREFIDVKKGRVFRDQHDEYGGSVSSTKNQWIIVRNR